MESLPCTLQGVRSQLELIVADENRVGNNLNRLSGREWGHSYGEIIASGFLFSAEQVSLYRRKWSAGASLLELATPGRNSEVPL
jgi:hypothetical protein